MSLVGDYVSSDEEVNPKPKRRKLENNKIAPQLPENFKGFTPKRKTPQPKQQQQQGIWPSLAFLLLEKNQQPLLNHFAATIPLLSKMLAEYLKDDSITVQPQEVSDLHISLSKVIPLTYSILTPFSESLQNTFAKYRGTILLQGQELKWKQNNNYLQIELFTNEQRDSIFVGIGLMDTAENSIAHLIEDVDTVCKQFGFYNRTFLGNEAKYHISIGIIKSPNLSKHIELLFKESSSHVIDYNIVQNVDEYLQFSTWPTFRLQNAVFWKYGNRISIFNLE